MLRGLADLDSDEVPRPGRVRRHPGRVPILEREQGLAEDLERLVDPVTRGDPESPLRWTAKSGARLAEALREMDEQTLAYAGASYLGPLQPAEVYAVMGDTPKALDWLDRAARWGGGFALVVRRARRVVGCG